MTETAPAGRIVAVTGGAGGIGREIAARLAAAGARVAIGDRDAAAEAAARALPGQVRGFALDVTDTGSYRRFLGAVEELWGPLDVLVTDAGLVTSGGESSAARTIAVNLHGVIVGVQLAAPGMRARGRGHIVAVAATTRAGDKLCAATQHGVLGYLGGVREELRGSGVEVWALMSGVAGSPFEGADPSGDIAAAVVDIVAAHSPGCSRGHCATPHRPHRPHRPM